MFKSEKFFESWKLEFDALRRRRHDKRLQRYSLGKLKDVKDKLFHLDPVGFVGTDEFPLRIHVGDLLLCHVVLQLRLILPVKRGQTTLAPTVVSSGQRLARERQRETCQRAADLLHNVLEKGEAEEVVGHVSCVEHEPTVSAALLGRGQRDLAVLHHLVATVHLADHAHSLRRVGFLHHLQGSSALLLLTGANHMARREQFRRCAGIWLRSEKAKVLQFFIYDFDF